MSLNFVNAQLTIDINNVGK